MKKIVRLKSGKYLIVPYWVASNATEIDEAYDSNGSLYSGERYIKEYCLMNTERRARRRLKKLNEQFAVDKFII